MFKRTFGKIGTRNLMGYGWYILCKVRRNQQLFARLACLFARSKPPLLFSFDTYH